MLSLRAVLADEGGFVHKRFIGGIKGFLKGGPVGAAAGFLTSGGPSVTAVPGTALTRFQPAAPVGCDTPGFVRNAQGNCVPKGFSGAKFEACPPGFVTILGRCVPTSVPSAISDPRSIGRPITEFVPSGGELVGPPRPGGGIRSFGPGGFEPELFATTTRRCPKGAVLAVDGLCYNRRDLRNNERMWPRGRRPLLTGGEMRCINVASSAAKKLQRKQKQLEQLGLLKRPARARRALPAGHVAQVKHG